MLLPNGGLRSHTLNAPSTPSNRYIAEDIRGGRLSHRQVTFIAWEAGVNSDNWSEGFPVTKPGAARPDSPLAAVSRTPQRLDLFFIGTDGAVGSVVWEAGVNSDNWPEGFPVTKPGAARPDSPLAVASRTPPRTDVFFVGNDGAVGIVAWELGVDHEAWSEGFPVTKPGAARPDSPLAAVSRTQLRLDVFFVGIDGAVGSVAWEAGVNSDKWSEGFPVTKPGAARDASPLAVASRTPQRLDLFFIGTDGAVGSVAWEAGVNSDNWSDGFPVTKPGAARV